MRRHFRVSLFTTLTLIIIAPIALQILLTSPVYAPPATEFAVPLYVDGFDNTKTGWNRWGSSPYLSAVDYPLNSINQTEGTKSIGDFTFLDVSSYDGGKIFIEIFARERGSGDDRVEIWLWDTILYVLADTLVPENEWSWVKSVDVSPILDSLTKINAAKAYLVKVSVDLPDILEIDAMRLSPEMQRHESHPNKYATDISPYKLDRSPNGDGLYSGWSVSSGGGAHYTRWDEYPTNNGDSDFLLAASSNLNETSNLAEPTVPTWAIESVNVTLAARQTQGDEQIRIMLVVGGRGYNGSLVQPPATGTTATYTYYSSVWTTNPATGQAWAWGDITDLQAGVRSQQKGAVWGVGGVGQLQVTQLFVGMWRVANPQNVFDADGTSYASFKYSTQSGTGRALEAWNFSSPWQYPAILKSPLPPISAVDFKMRYNVSANTAGLPDDYYSISYRVGASASQSLVPNRYDTFSYLPVTGFDNTRTGWRRTGTSPYLGSVDSNYVNVSIALLPNGNGGYTAWTGDYAAWDEYPTNDGDTTYVSATASNLNETSDVQDPAAANTWIIGRVKLTILARQSVGGNERVRLMLVVNNRADNGSLVQPLSVYTEYTFDWAANPAFYVNSTGNYPGPWNWTAINTLQAGVRSEAYGTWSGEIRVTQMFVEVFPQAADAIGDFTFGPLASYDGGPVLLQIYAKGDGDDQAYAYIYNGTAFIEEYPIIFTPEETLSWTSSFDISSTLRTLSQINGAKVYFEWRTGGTTAGNMEINAARLKVLKKGFFYEPTTITWASRSEPINGTWEWDDINNIKFSVGFSGTGGDAGCQFNAFEMWVEVYAAKPKFTVRPSSIIDYARAPTPFMTLRPNANGSIRHWLAFPSTLNPSPWDAVNDTDPNNGDTDYIYASAHNRIEHFNFEDPPPGQTGNIASVRVVAYARSDVATDDQIQLGLFMAGTTVRSDETFSVTTNYQKFSFDWGVNPQTATYWTWANLIGLQAGVVTSQKGTSWTGQIRVTQLYVQVLYESGPQLTVDMKAENVVDLWAYTFMLSYDKRVLTATGRIMLSPFTSSLTAVNNVSAGWIYLSASMPVGTAMGVTGNASVVRIIFVVEGYGYTALTNQQTRLVSSRAASIGHSVYSGEFENAVRDLAVRSIVTATLAYKGYNRTIAVDVKNEGASITESFGVTVKFFNSTYQGTIGTQSVSLAPGLNQTLRFKWVTASFPGLAYGNYSVSASVPILPERDTADNSLTFGYEVKLTVAGNVNADNIVDIFDILKVKNHWYPGPPVGLGGYNRNVDINDDGAIDVFDILIVKANWNKPG